MYHLHVTDVTDYNFLDVFRATEGLSLHTGNTYWVGNKDINGKARVDYDKQTPKLVSLPIGPNSHPKIENVVPKKSYTFKIEMKTKGDFYSTQEGLLIKPTFFYVTKDGKKRTEVDLYYHTNDKKYIKIGSVDDKTNRSIIWNDAMRNIHNDQFIANSIGLWIIL